MKRSEINKAISQATNFFEKHGWTLPPNPKWDVTDFSLNKFATIGLVLVNLAEEPEYCEKLMYAAKNQSTPAHCHKKKKEDIICRTGILSLQLWRSEPDTNETADRGEGVVEVKRNGEIEKIPSGEKITIKSGERVTIFPGVWHEFHPLSDECIIGEVSTANDDTNDNFFANKEIGRYSEIVEDEEITIRLLNE